MKSLQSENERLRRQLTALMDDARANESIHRRFQALELSLLDAKCLSDLVHYLMNDAKQVLNVDVVTLSLYDSEGVTQSVLLNEGAMVSDTSGLVFFEDENELTALFGEANTPIFGSLYSNDYSHLFVGYERRHGSVILLPLIRNNAIIGSLNIGSFNPRRFVSGLGTEFLERLASVLSVCIENGIHVGRLKQLSLTDVLTGVNNRRNFDMRIKEEIARANRDKTSLSCVFIDLDHFKTINDRYGHRIGDRVLKDVAHLVALQLRQGDFLARYGGEEFTLLLPNTTSKGAIRMAERIRKAIGSMVFYNENSEPFQITVSMGIASIETKKRSKTDAIITVDELIKQADKALYDAKEAGRDCIMLDKAA